MNFAEWSALSEAERKSEKQHWHILEPGYWHSIAIEAVARFEQEFGSLPQVTQIFKSLYHARELLIAVQTNSTHPKKTALPKSYLGFRVMEFHDKVPDGVLVRPGPPGDSRLTERAPAQKRGLRSRTREEPTEEHQVLRLEGEIDLHCSPSVAATLSEAIEKKPKKLVLDLSKVDYIDSSGLAVLINGMRKVGAYGGVLYLVGMQDSVKTIFETSRLDQAFRIFPDVAGALAGIT